MSAEWHDFIYIFLELKEAYYGFFFKTSITGAVVVIAIAGLVVAAAISLTNNNNTQAEQKANQMWEQAGDQIENGGN